MFAAILGRTGPVDQARMVGPLADCEAQSAGSSGRAVFVTSKGAGPSDDEWRGIERLENRLWVAGRIRLDRRAELRGQLDASADMGACSDAMLCLLAYAKWGEGFVERLSGDFCFALWDDAKASLLAARDQLGVRTLFHADAGEHLLISDSLDWIAARQAIDCALDDYWIADFLCVGRSLDFDRTVYRAIRRLPPAHLLKMSSAGASLRRYWRLEVAEPLRLRDSRLYAERFRELVGAAVADRLPGAGRVGVAMSGGLDSTTLAALAVAVTSDARRVVAECVHYERLMADEEAHFSTVAAGYLGIDLRLRAVDDLTYDPAWRARPIGTPEPFMSIIFAEHDRRIAGEMAGAAPVWLHGEGPDNAFSFERDAYLSWLARRGEWLELAEALLRYVASKGPASWMETAKRYAGPSAESPLMPNTMPGWLDPAFVARLGIAERMREANNIVDLSHPWHPRAIGSFGNPIWQRLFGAHDFSEAQAPLVWRHPFLDLRVLQFALSVPPVPWAREKLVMREAMRGRLPKEVLRRKKSPLARSPIAEPIREHGLGALPPGHLLDGYVVIDWLPASFPAAADLHPLIAVHALDHWIRYNHQDF